MFPVKLQPRIILQLLLLLALAFSPSVFASKSPPSGLPSVLFIYVDDLGFGDLGSYGHPVIKTPNLDRLAEQGVRLTNYYAPSALCSPSRAAVLTGRMPYRLGIKSWIPDGSGIYLRDQEITLAELLKSQGYHTSLIGKWHLNSDLGSQSEPQPQDQGFDYFYGHNAFQIPSNRNPTNIYRNGKALGVQSGYTADLYADEAITWLGSIPSESPFFLFLSMAEPHSQFENPPEYNKMYSQFTRGDIVPIVSESKDPPKAKLIPRGPGEYYANITYMDAQLGRVLQALDQSGRADQTIVVFASDNGAVTSNWYHWYEVNAHGSNGGLRGRKHQLYEGGIKVPAIVRFPGKIRPASSSSELITGTDLFVTLARLAGAQVPKDRAIDGIDVLPALQGAQLPERTLVWALPTQFSPEFVIRRGQWKLFLDKSRRPVELYDLREDPLEFFNLLNDQPGQVHRLENLFRQQFASIDSDQH